jgi:hypothetical protein
MDIELTLDSAKPVRDAGDITRCLAPRTDEVTRHHLRHSSLERDPGIKSDYSCAQMPGAVASTVGSRTRLPGTSSRLTMSHRKAEAGRLQTWLTPASAAKCASRTKLRRPIPPTVNLHRCPTPAKCAGATSSAGAGILGASLASLQPGARRSPRSSPIKRLRFFASRLRRVRSRSRGRCEARTFRPSLSWSRR